MGALERAGVALITSLALLSVVNPVLSLFAGTLILVAGPCQAWRQSLRPRFSRKVASALLVVFLCSEVYLASLGAYAMLPQTAIANPQDRRLLEKRPVFQEETTRTVRQLLASCAFVLPVASWVLSRTPKPRGVDRLL